MAHDDDGLRLRLEALFFEELQDNVRILADGLAELGHTARAEAEPVVHRLFRAAHSLKGAAHAAGVTRAVGPCDRLEGLLAKIRDGDRTLDDTTIGSLHDGLDALAALERDLRSRGADAAPSGAGSPAAEGSTRASAAVTHRPPPGDGRARVDVVRLDRLVRRSGALVSSMQQVQLLADDIVAVGETADSEDRRSRRALTPRDAPVQRSPVPATLRRLAAQANDIERQLRRLAGEVAGTAQELRLQPFRDVTAGLESSVREVCRSTGTEARLVIEGGDVEFDRDIGDAIREPLLHLVRNAVDHGIEDPGRRTELGKAPTGTVCVSAVGRGAHVVVTVSDDGTGLDVEALRRSAGRSTEESTSGEDDLALAFLPGLSTATAVSDVSGRGVGLDAARAKVESLGGTIHLRTDPGHGTEVEVQVPRTLAVLRVLTVDAGHRELVAMPASGVTRLHRLTSDEIEHLEGRLAVTVDGRRRPAVGLRTAVGRPADSADTGSHSVAVEITDEEGVLLVERADADLDVVLQPLPTRIGGAAGILGAALLPDGRSALVVNPAALLRVGLSAPAPPLVPQAPHRRRRVLLAEDTLTTRALERSILETAGYEVLVAADGADALELLRDETVDVVVSDVDMPRLSGIDLCREMRSSVRLSDIPVILVTSLASEQDRRSGLEAGANAYLVKSAFEQAALLDAVKRFA